MNMVSYEQRQKPTDEGNIKLSDFIQKQQTQIDKLIFSPNMSFQSLPSSESLTDQQNTLLTIITCLLCSRRASQAHICPNCSKFYCLTCITQWIADQDSKCPYCTEPLQEKQLVNCQNLFDELSNAMETMKLSKSKLQKNCSTHQLPLHYYCKDCQTELCSDCSSLSTQHNGHKFMKTSEAKKEFEKENTQLKNKLNSVKLITQKLLDFLKLNPNHLEENLQKDHKKFTQFIKNLKQRTNKKFITEIAQLQKIIEVQKDIANQKNSLYHLSLQFIKDCSKIQFVAAEADLLEEKLNGTLKELKHQNEELRKNWQKIQGKKSESEIYPSYQVKTFSFMHFGQMCYQNNVVYSETLEANGVEWRLKIYPAGSTEQTEPRKEETFFNPKNILNSHVSIFVEMTNSLREKGKYRHKVVIEHPLNKQKNIERQFESEFDRGECWGYDKFSKISNLYEGGFVDEKNEELRISLMIAPANYQEACEDMKAFVGIRKKYLEEISKEIPSKIE